MRKKNSTVSIRSASVWTAPRKNAPIAEWVERDAIKGFSVASEEKAVPLVKQDRNHYRHRGDRSHAS